MLKFARTLVFTSVSLFCSTAYTQQTEPPPATSVGSDTVDVQHVMDAYHQAVVTHDGARLQALFLPQGSLWLNVLSDASYARIQARSPSTPKVKVGSVQDFARFVSTSKAALNPTHTNPRIFTDGTIASVYFDFIFLVDGKEQNRGGEAWQLVKAAEGWRIAAITYTSNPQLP